VDDETFALERIPVHLGRAADAHTLPEMDGTNDWFDRYRRATEADGNDGRLVSMYTFTEPWTTWEVHPNGHEVVVCTSGTMTLHQEIEGSLRIVTLHAGEATINAPGVWHTADVDAPATALFITAGMGTQVRPR
jgi:mannose-6-phosphate isomerase-like protein (cupin superfamily)